MKAPKILITIAAILAGAIVAHAQQDPTSQINDIKRSNRYIHAESTSIDWNDALKNATILLERKITDWLVEHDSIFSVSVLMNDVKSIKASRSDFYRAFVYVLRPDVEIEPIQNNPPIDVKEPEPPVKTVTVPENTKQPAVTDTAKTVTPAPVEPAKTKTEEDLMLEVTAFGQIKEYILSLKDKGKLLDYGKYSTLPEGPFYAFIYTTEGKIKAVIRNDIKGQYNLATGQKDDMKQYSGCGAIWFRMK